MNKRGEYHRVVLSVFYIILVIIITYFLYNFIEGLASREGYNKKYFVNDFGLTIDAVQSANHDLEIKYKNLKDYTLRIFNGEISISGEVFRYRYVLDKNQEISGEFVLRENQTLIINKKGNSIYFNINNEN